MEERIYIKRLKLDVNGIDPSFHLPYRKKTGGETSVAVNNSELPQESPIFNFSGFLPVNLDTLYLNVVGIQPSPKKTIKNRIDFFNCDEMIMRIKTSSLILMGKLVPFFMSLQMRRSLKITERTLFPWEGRDMLKSNIKLGVLF